MTARWTGAHDFAFILKSTAALVVDATDPNTTVPDDKRCVVTPLSSGQQTVLSLVAEAGCTVVGWIWSELCGTWVKLFTQALTALTVAQIANVPDNVPLFLQLTVNGGNAKYVAAMFH